MVQSCSSHILKPRRREPKHLNGSPDFIMMTLMTEKIILPMATMPMKTKMFLFYPMALCLPQVTLLMCPPPPRPGFLFSAQTNGTRFAKHSFKEYIHPSQTKFCVAGQNTGSPSRKSESQPSRKYIQLEAAANTHVIFPQMSNPSNKYFIFQIVSKFLDCGVERGICRDIYENLVKVSEKYKETKTRIYLIRSGVCPPFHYRRSVHFFQTF